MSQLSLIYGVMSIPPTVAPTMAIANSKGMLGREYSCSHGSAKAAGGRTYMIQLLKRHAFPKQENTTSCKKYKKIMLHNIISKVYKTKSSRRKFKLHCKLL